jgi:hypothetical protein
MMARDALSRHCRIEGERALAEDPNLDALRTSQVEDRLRSGRTARWIAVALNVRAP